MILGVEALGTGINSPHIIGFYSYRNLQALVDGKRCI